MHRRSSGRWLRTVFYVSAFLSLVVACGDRSTTVRPDPVTNDGFLDATVLPDDLGVVTANTSGAGKEPGEPDHAGRPGGASAWWSFEAPTDGTLRARTTGSTFDTLLAIYTGDTLESLIEVGSDDDGGDGTTSDLSVPVTGGTWYHLAVDGYRGATGTLHLGWRFTPGGESYEVTVTRAGTGSGTVTSSPDGIDCGSTCSALFAAGTSVTLTASPASDSEFTGWSGACDGTGACTLDLAGDVTATALFDARSTDPDPGDGAWLRLDVTPNAAAWTVREGGPTGPLVASGDGDQALSLDPGTYFVEVSASSYQSASASITLVAGDDETLSITLSELPPETVGWRIDPDLVSGSADVGDTPSDGAFNVYNDGNVQGAFDVTGVPDWASISPSSGMVDGGGNDQNTVTVTFDACMVEGVDEATITVAGDGDSDTLELRRVCNEADTVRWRVAPSEVFVEAEVDDTPSGTTVLLYNDGNVTGSYQVEGAPAWATLDPATGSVDGGSGDYDAIDVTFATCTHIDFYDATATITGSGDSVTLRLVRDCTLPPIVMWQPSLSTVGSSADVGATPSSRVFRIYNMGPDDGTYTITSVPSWATVSPTTGLVPGGSMAYDQITVDYAACTAPGLDDDDITISGGGDTTTVTLQRTCREVSTTGELSVSVSGLPSGTGANAVLVEPDGATRVVTASTRLQDLTPGSYRLIAGTVVSGTTAYVPTSESQTFDVTSGATTDATIRYASSSARAIVPAGSTCSGATPAGGTCTIDIALVSNTATWQAFQTSVLSDDFAVQDATVGALLDGASCYVQTSSTGVGAICVGTFSGAGDLVTVTLERTGSGPSRLATSHVTLSRANGDETNPLTGSYVVP